jgi:hypothetical protein
MSFMNIIMIVAVLSKIIQSTPSLVETYGVVMTGSPSHGDYVFCWDGNIQIVLSGGLCNTEKIGIGKFTRESVNNNDIITMYEKILSHKIPIKCGDYFRQYYIVATKSGCMLSTSDKETSKNLHYFIPTNWDIMNKEKNTIIFNAGLLTKPHIWFNFWTGMFFISLAFTMLICF